MSTAKPAHLSGEYGAWFKDPVLAAAYPAPIPVWSGNPERVRLNRGGIRQLNVALHRIAVTQLAHPCAGRSYVERRIASGDTKTEAIRALRRRLSDEVYRRLMKDAAPGSSFTQGSQSALLT
jgi:transposase